MADKTTTQKDVVSRLTESGEEALQKLLQNPGTAKVLGAANSLKERVDDLTKRMRSLDPLEKRVAELERRLDELGGKPKPKPKPKAAAAKPKPASRTPSRPASSAAKKPAARPKKP